MAVRVIYKAAAEAEIEEDIDESQKKSIRALVAQLEQEADG